MIRTPNNVDHDLQNALASELTKIRNAATSMAPRLPTIRLIGRARGHPKTAANRNGEALAAPKAHWSGLIGYSAAPLTEDP